MFTTLGATRLMTGAKLAPRAARSMGWLDTFNFGGADSLATAPETSATTVNAPRRIVPGLRNGNFVFIFRSPKSWLMTALAAVSVTGRTNPHWSVFPIHRH